jgi:hypothetical protein
VFSRRELIPSIIRPMPCLLPVLIRLGGLSTTETKLGSSAGCTGRRAVFERYLQARQGRAKAIFVPSQLLLRKESLEALHKPQLDACIVRILSCMPN